MPPILTPTRALERLQRRLDQASPDAAVSLQMLLVLIPPARPDSIASLAEIVERGGIGSGLRKAMTRMAYNPLAIAVPNAERAVREMGMEQAHELAVSLLLARCAGFLISPSALAEVESLALASGLLARELARRQEICDPEFGLVCTLLRNFGRLLMAGVLCDESAEARALGVALDEDDRYVAIFGLSPLKLSYHLFASGHFPEALVKELENLPSYLPTTASFTHEEEVIRLTDLALKLCALSENTELTEEGVIARVDRVLEDLDMAPRIRGGDVQTMFLGVIQQLAIPRTPAPPGLDTRFIARRRLESLCPWSPPGASSLSDAAASF